MIHRSVIPRTRLAAVLLVTAVIFGAEQSSAALQYQPIDPYTPGDECALVLNGPGRSSAFDYTYNLLRGSFPPSAGSQTCITYDAVNHAYVEARKRINVAQPNTETWRGEDLATVGELLLDISINLAQKYGLSYEDVEKGLPLIDTSKTLIREICPAFLSNVECRPGKYRRYDGLCTNLENPTWGATMTPFTRLLAPKYADGINAPRVSVTGNQLPLARVVSRTMHPDEGYHDHAGTVMVIAWGQFMDHDYTLTATPLDPLDRNDPEECCNRAPHQKNPYCNEILIPEDDYFYRLFNVRCMNFVRGFPAPRPGCRLGSRVQFNLLTGVLDGNTVYGSSDAFARKLRTGYGGLLRMNPVFAEYGLKDLLPLKLDIPDEGCTRPNRSMYCFEAGEIRVNEQLVLTCMHTLLAREHNRAANALAEVNPHWDDETIFQEARRINIAEIQHVTYNEFLPILLGKEVMEKFGLLLEKDGYWDGYDSSVNPGVIDAFAAAAYRFGHSLLPTAVERWSKAHKFIASKRLSDLIRRPYDLYRAGVLDEYFMGLMNQVAQAMDDSITQEVTNHLFKKVGAKFGMDLVSFNMQRGREFGIPSYMEFRKFCGLPGADTFEELFGSMPNETIRRYSSIFEHPSDVDLWSGGVSERPLPGSMLGPTFACIIATQFSYSRRGDRFWYELPNQPSSFTPEQLVEIRKARLSRLICDNTDLIDTIQLYPMVLPDHEINPRVPCRSGVLPSIDFSKWAEFPSGVGNAAEYNFAGVWPPLAKLMPPLVYARLPKTVKRKFMEPVKKMVPARKTDFKLSDLRPLRRSGSFEANNLPINREQKAESRAWPALMIQKSTKIFGRIPADNNFERYPLDASMPSSYFFEKSELEISPIDNIFREKRYSLKTFFDDLSNNAFSRRADAARFRRRSSELERYRDEAVDQGTDQADNVSRLLAILAPNHPADPMRRESFRHRSKRQATEDEVPDRKRIGEPEEQERRRILEKDSKVQENGRRQPQYTPVFNECNDTTAASEVSDLNAPPPPPERRLTLQSYSRNGPELPKDIDYVPKRNPSVIDGRKNEHSVIPRVIPPAVGEQKVVEAPRETASTLKNAQNATYINLQDHQKGTQDGNVPKDANGYPLDIAPYNPDIIPYVDVPDYTDQREESLDKDDRRVAKERYVEYPDDDADVIDPGVPLKSSKRSEEIIVRDEDVVDREEVAEGPKDLKSRDAAEENQEEEKEVEDDEGEDGRSRAPDESENAEEEKDIEETISSKDIRNSESDDVKDFEPVHFDLDEYKKPFNLEELFKDIELEAQKAQEKDNKTKVSAKDVNEHQGSKNIPVRDDGHEAISGVSGKYEDGGEFELLTFDNPVQKANYENQDTNKKKNAPSDETIPSQNFFEEFERVFGPGTSEAPFPSFFDTEDDKEGLPGASAGLVESEDEKYPYGDENTYERLFGTAGDEENKEDDDSGFQVDKKKSSEIEDDEPTEESLRKAYKALAPILDRKDDISRLDDEVAQKAKKEGKMPSKYNNYWSLEYGTPKELEGKT